MVGGDHRERAHLAKIISDSYGQRRALFRVSGRAKLVQQDQGMRGRGAGDGINLGHVRGKR